MDTIANFLIDVSNCHDGSAVPMLSEALLDAFHDEDRRVVKWGLKRVCIRGKIIDRLSGILSNFLGQGTIDLIQIVHLDDSKLLYSFYRPMQPNELSIRFFFVSSDIGKSTCFSR